MKVSVLFVLIALTAAPLRADDAKLSQLENKIDVLTQEIERLKLGSAAEEPDDLKSTLGFAPAASKVYRKGVRKISIGGYGEMIYNNFRGRRQNNAVAATSDKSDFLRAILYVGYKFNDWITFNSETEFEHASSGKRGEVSVEMAQLDFRPWKSFGVRAGLLLMPVGLTNEFHEPTVFHGVNRPSVDSNIIPTTWRENGAGFFGEIGPLSYKTYLVAGLQAVTDPGANPVVTGFSSSSAWRSARSSGSNSKMEDMASVTRVDIAPVEGTSFGASYYFGEADQQMVAAHVPVRLWEVHARGQWRGMELDGVYADGHIGNVDVLNVAQSRFVGSNSGVGSDFFGGYITAAYDVLTLVDGTEQYLAPFFRYERYDTQQKTPNGWLKNPSNSRVEWTMGLTYKPISQVVCKFDHQVKKDQGLTGIGQTNLGIGYMF